jgi:hypothetical protein
MQLWSLLDIVQQGGAGEARWWQLTVVQPIESRDSGKDAVVAKALIGRLVDLFLLGRQRLFWTLPLRYDSIVQCSVSQLHRHFGAAAEQHLQGTLG